MSVCRAARDAIYGLRHQEKGSSRTFYPVDRLRIYFTNDKVREILSCTCPTCREDLGVFDSGTEPTDYVQRTRGKLDLDGSRDSFYSVFGLLVHIEHPLFIVGFVDFNCNDSLLERWAASSSFSHDDLKRCTGDYKRYSGKYNRFAKLFFAGLFRFAVPHLKVNGFSHYSDKTVLPFVQEEEIVQKTAKDWHLIPVSGRVIASKIRVFTFRIYQEYNFPRYSSSTGYVRKCIATPTPQAFLDRSNIQYVRQLEDEHIVTLLQVYGHGESINFIMPIAWTNLDHLLRDWKLKYDTGRDTRLEKADAWNQLLGIANALKRIHGSDDHASSRAGVSMHSHICAHLDLKPDNILVDWDGTWLITDFGQAALVEDRTLNTNAYAPPEIDDPSIAPGRAFDIWSLGCIMLEVVTFMVLGHIGLNCTGTFEGLDQARKVEPSPRSKGYGERFWYRKSANGEYVVKEKIQAFKASLEWRNTSSADVSAASTELLSKTIGLINSMLQPKAAKRTDISRVVDTLTSALAQASRGPTETTHQIVEVAPDEVILGGRKVNEIKLLDPSASSSDMGHSSLEILQGDTGFIRLCCWARDQQSSVSFRRSDAKIVPMYAFCDREKIPGLSAWIELLVLSPNRCVKVPGSRYSFHRNSGLSEARLIQSVMTSQNIVDSFDLGNSSLHKAISASQALKALLRRRKVRDANDAAKTDEPQSDLGSATVQLWIEQPPPAPRGVNDHGLSASRPVRLTRINPRTIPPCRVAIYFHGLRFVCTIKMDKNWVIEESTLDNRVLHFIPLPVGRNSTFYASWLRSTPEELNDAGEYPAGIPLDPRVLRAYEDIDSIEVQNLTLTFLSNEDRDAFKWKYLATKKAWDLKRQKIGDTAVVNKAPSIRQQFPMGVVDLTVPAKRTPFSVNTSVSQDLETPMSTGTARSTQNSTAENMSLQNPNTLDFMPQQEEHQESRLEIPPRKKTFEHDRKSAASKLAKETNAIGHAQHVGSDSESNHPKLPYQTLQSPAEPDRLSLTWKTEEATSDRDEVTPPTEYAESEATVTKPKLRNASEAPQRLNHQIVEALDHPDNVSMVNPLLTDSQMAKCVAIDDDLVPMISRLQDSDSPNVLLHVSPPSESARGTTTQNASQDDTKESLTLIDNGTKKSSTLMEDGIETIYTLDGSDTNPRSQRIQIFVSQLIQDVAQDFSSYVKEIHPTSLVDIVRTFARRLYEESTDPFQWETSVVLHQKQWEIVRLLASIDIPSTNEVVLEHEEEEDDYPDENRTPFQKSSLDIQSWVVEVHDGSEPAPETNPESAIQSEPQKNDPGDANVFDEAMSILEAEKKDLQQSVAYKEFVSRSDAYRWLVASLHQSPGQLSGDIESMVAIRAYVRDQLRQQQPLRTLSRQRPPAMINLTVKLEWNPIQIALSYGFKYPFSGILDNLYCLTGSETEAQVTTIVEYMTQMWPSTGTALITLMRELVSKPEGDVCFYQFSKPAKARLTAILHERSQCLVTITGGPYLVSEVVEQLGWLSSAIQLPPVNKGIVACIPKVGGFTTRPSAKIVSGVAVIAECRLTIEFQDPGFIQSGQPISQIPLRLRPYLIHGFPTLRSVEMMQEDGTGTNPVLVNPSRMNSDSLQTMRLQLPGLLRQVVETTPKSLIEAHPRNDESVLNKGKLWLEDYTGFLFDWRPLKNPRENVPPGMWRVEWTMLRHRLQTSTTEENALLLQDLLSVVKEHPGSCDCCIPKAPPLSLIDVIDLIGNTLTSYAQSCMGIVSHANQASSSAAQKYTPSNTNPSGATNSKTSLHLRGQKNTATAPPQSSTPPTTTASIIPASLQQTCHQVLFAVKGSRWSWELEPVAMTNAICDSTFFHSLRTHHRAHRHAYLHWISPFRFKNCRCVKLDVVEPHRVLAGTQQALPDYYGQASSYEYAPRPPNVKLPLIDPRHYLILLSECPPTCLWRLWPTHECIRLHASKSHRLKIPRRKDDIKDLLDAGEGVAFGIEADYVLSLRILAAYHLAAIVPAFIFWAFWLSKHEGDWQNASVPLLTVLALTTVFWIMAGKRVGIS